MIRSSATVGRVCAWVLAAAALSAGACSSGPAATAEAQNAGQTAAGGAKPEASKAPASPAPQAPSAPPVSTPEEQLRAEVASWKGTPYLENGKTRTGVDNPGFVSGVFHGAFGIDIPSEYSDQMHTGKLVARDKLAPGDLVFFEGQGFGPFKSHVVAIFVADDQVALATRDLGIATVKLSDPKWSAMFKTARRIPREPSQGAPTFDASKFGSDRAALLHEIARAWSGTLYKQGGTTFDGIGNEEFVRAVYEAVNDTELEGGVTQWEKMGDTVPRDTLEPGDIIIYSADGMGAFFNQKHAGIYIGGGDFVHAVKGSAVTIDKLADQQWSQAFQVARRIDPEVLTRIEETRAAAAEREAAAAKVRAAAKPAPVAASARPAARTAKPASSRAAPAGAPAAVEPAPEPEVVVPYSPTDEEKRLRAAVEPWKGTPYKLGGETKSGVDCSAFVRAVYKTTYDVNLPRTADVQEDLGIKIRREDLQVGDLVFFRTQGMGPFFKSRHVGIYVGNGEFAQSSGTHGVVISRLDNYYWNKKYEGARRLPPHDQTVGKNKQ